MQFLNDKFFKTAVILFFLLMALPFMFSEPESEKKDNTPALEFKDKNPVYNIINKIAKFYGLKKESYNKEFSLKEEPFAVVKKQIAQKKEEQLKQNKLEQTKNNSLTATKENAPSAARQEARPNAQNYNTAWQKNKASILFENQEYESLSDKDKNKSKSVNVKNNFYISTLLPKSNRPNINKTDILQTANPLSAEQKNFSPDIKKQEQQNLTQTNTATQINKKNILSGPNKASKSTFDSYFKNSAKAGKDFLNHIDSSIKNIQFLKQNQNANTQEQAKNSPSYSKSYRMQIFNPKSQKTEIVLYQKTFSQDDVKNAEFIKKITALGIQNKQYNDKTFTDSHGNETPYPSDEEIALLKNGTPPHILFNASTQNTDLDKSFENSYRKALHALPDKDYPSLEFVYKNKDNEILRAPNESFNVIAIRKILADKVSLPVKQDNIDFLDIKNSIYVVPQESLYEEYSAMNIPVICYPDLSPENLGKAYQTAGNAIEILLSNKTRQLENEKKQNQSEIEIRLKEE